MKEHVRLVFLSDALRDSSRFSLQYYQAITMYYAVVHDHDSNAFIMMRDCQIRLQKVQSSSGTAATGAEAGRCTLKLQDTMFRCLGTSFLYRGIARQRCGRE